jgi:hypothetical protein
MFRKTPSTTTTTTLSEIARQSTLEFCRRIYDEAESAKKKSEINKIKTKCFTK